MTTCRTYGCIDPIVDEPTGLCAVHHAAQQELRRSLGEKTRPAKSPPPRPPSPPPPRGDDIPPEAAAAILAIAADAVRAHRLGSGYRMLLDRADSRAAIVAGLVAAARKYDPTKGPTLEVWLRYRARRLLADQVRIVTGQRNRLKHTNRIIYCDPATLPENATHVWASSCD
jgi:hypothetical protein